MLHSRWASQAILLLHIWYGCFSRRVTEGILLLELGVTFKPMQVDKDSGASESDAGPLRHETSQVVYPLGFDDPAGLQSQQSVSLLPALSVAAQGSLTSETLHATLDDMEAGRAGAHMHS